MMNSPSWQTELPGIPSAAPQRSVRERSVLASQLYSSASAHFERFTSTSKAGEPDWEAAKRWQEERKRADMVMNGQA
jgi:hypothetical protein